LTVKEKNWKKKNLHRVGFYHQITFGAKIFRPF